jgi:hypothetical protein
MTCKDFKIGDYFFAGASKWLCTDVGTRTVVAKRVGDEDETEVVFDDRDFDHCREGKKP